MRQSIFKDVINIIINIFTSQLKRPDKNRIKELGPDRSCAEWLLRNGATVKWKGSTRWQTDYNTLPSTDNKRVYQIEEVDVDEAGIMDVGFDYFSRCFDGLWNLW